MIPGVWDWREVNHTLRTHLLKRHVSRRVTRAEFLHDFNGSNDVAIEFIQVL